MATVRKTIDWEKEDERVSARVAAHLLERAIYDVREVAFVLSEDLAGTRALEDAFERLKEAGYEVEPGPKETRVLKFGETVALFDHGNGLNSFIEQSVFGDLALALRAAAKGGRR